MFSRALRLFRSWWAGSTSRAAQPGRGASRPLRRYEPLEDRHLLRVFLFPTEIRAETDETDHFDVIPRLGAAQVAIAGHDVLRPKASGRWDAVSWFNETANQDVASGLVAGVGALSGVRVRIPTGVALTYNRDNASPAELFTLEIGGALTFDNTASRTLRVGTIYVLPDDQSTPAADAGQLAIRFPDANKTASIIFTDMGWAAGNALGALDPKHFSGGLIGYGKVDLVGAAHTTTTAGAAGTWAYAAGGLTQSAPDASTATIALDRAVPEWKKGDCLFLPDTRMVVSTNQFRPDVEVWDEELQIVADPALVNGKTVLTVSGVGAHAGHGLRYDHPAVIRQDVGQSVASTPPIGLLTRNLVLRTDAANVGAAWIREVDLPYAGAFKKEVDEYELSLQQRGHVLFGGRAEINVQGAQFQDLGRTTAHAPTTITFGGASQSNPANQIGRYAVHLHHLLGAANGAAVDALTGRAATYQFTFSGNSIVGSKKWALAIHDSSWGDLSRNVIYRAEGAGVVTEDGSEIGNQIKQNLVGRIRGRLEYTGGDRGNVVPYDDGQGGQAFAGDKHFNDVARGGSAFWFARTGNFVEGNVSFDTAFAAYDFSGYYGSPIRYPRGPGKDKASGDFATDYVDKEFAITARDLADPRPVSDPQALWPYLSAAARLDSALAMGSFKDNVAIGRTTYGFWLSAGAGFDVLDPQTDQFRTPRIVVENLQLYNSGQTGVFLWYAANLEFRNTQIVANMPKVTNVELLYAPTGFALDQTYPTSGLMIDGGRIEGLGVGITTSPGDQSRLDLDRLRPKLDGDALFNGTTVRNLTLKNWLNVRASPPRTHTHGASSILFDRVTFERGRYAQFDASKPERPNFRGVPIDATNIYMFFAEHDATRNFLGRAAVYLKNVTFVGAQAATSGGVLQQVYFKEQAPDYQLGPSSPSLLAFPLPNEPVGQPPAAQLKTNRELWNSVGVAAAGMVAPDAASESTALAWGLKNALVGEPPSAVIAPGQRIALAEPWDGAVALLSYKFAGGQIVPAAAKVAFRWRPRINGGWTANERIDGEFKPVGGGSALPAAHSNEYAFYPNPTVSGLEIGQRYRLRAFVSRKTDQGWMEVGRGTGLSGPTSKTIEIGIAHDLRLDTSATFAAALSAAASLFNSYANRSLTPRISFLQSGEIRLAGDLVVLTGLDIYVAAGSTLTISAEAGKKLRIGGGLTKSGPGKLILSAELDAPAATDAPAPLRQLTLLAGQLQLDRDLGRVGAALWDVAARKSPVGAASPVQPRTTLMLTASQHLKSLSIGAGATVQMVARSIGDNALTSGDKRLVVGTLTIDADNGGSLDLNNQTLIVDYSGKANPAAAIRDLIARSRVQTSGTAAVGLFSSLVQDSTATALGMIDNGSFGYATIDLSNRLRFEIAGEPLPVQAVIVKFAYVGDVDLNGLVDGDDWAGAWVGKSQRLSGWDNGDLNYDGLVDDKDLSLLLSGRLRQGKRL